MIFDYQHEIEKELTKELRSQAYKDGMLYGLKWQFGERLAISRPDGTVEYDAFELGVERGRELSEKLRVKY